MICPSLSMDDLGTNPDTELKHNRTITLQEVLHLLSMVSIEIIPELRTGVNTKLSYSNLGGCVGYNKWPVPLKNSYIRISRLALI